ncbi:hypothetical protein MAR_001651 [Mya arenaria]|uniref:Uncharacterized protein n=1 Tax=Mya arenaria TaxID=6604 RepID=A0ABY7FCB8_MYAAR|nr:hypothetical protein MAR_001651 [Mya arenaria]
MRNRCFHGSCLLDATVMPSDNICVQHGLPRYIANIRSRPRKVKFVGRRIKHQWIEGDGSRHWYKETVLSIVKGVDCDMNAVYQDQYDGNDDLHYVDSLQADYNDGTLTYHDIQI